MELNTKVALLVALACVAPSAAHAMQDTQAPARTQAGQQGESSQPVDDTWTKVKADLLTSSNVPGTEIKVETVNGTVTLSGTVSTQAEKDKAVKTAKGIKGVRTVEAGALKVTTR
jgi:hyperosmotically inducible protein